MNEKDGMDLKLEHLQVLYIDIVLLRRKKRISCNFIKGLGMLTEICSLGKFSCWLHKAFDLWLTKGHAYIYVYNTIIELVKGRLLVES